MTSTLSELIKKSSIVKPGDVGRRLGKGANGEIWNVGNGKILKYGTESYRNAKKEFDIMKNLRTKLTLKGYEPFVPAVHGNFLHIPGTKGTLFVMNKVPGETLSTFSERATPEQIDFIHNKLLQYVNTLERIGVVHGDLHPNNIMIEVLPDGELKVTIIDFGRSRFKKNNEKHLFGRTIVHPMPTKIRCPPGGTSRMCAMKYRFSHNANEPTMISNREALKAIFGTKGGIASRATRLKNAINIIYNKGGDLQLASNTLINKGVVKRVGQRGKLRGLLTYFEKENDRIPEIIKLLNLERNEIIKTNDRDVQQFISILQGIQKAGGTIPSISPTNEQKNNFGKLYNTLTTKSNRMKGYKTNIEKMKASLEKIRKALKVPSPPKAPSPKAPSPPKASLVSFKNILGTRGVMKKGLVNNYRQQAMNALAARKAKQLPPIRKSPPKISPNGQNKFKGFPLNRKSPSPQKPRIPINNAALTGALAYYMKNKSPNQNFGPGK